ncbi:MAG: hypothetical protein P8Z33_14290 [Gammaproteobacteria bacterium]
MMKSGNPHTPSRWRDLTTGGVGLAFLMLLVVPLGLTAQEGEGMEPLFPQQQSAGDLLHACAASRLTATGRERGRGLSLQQESGLTIRLQSISDVFIV